MIHVVAAVIERDGSYLVTRRPAGTHLAGLWEFPGGKVSAGETHAEALVREIDEELAAAVAVGALLASSTHDYGDRVVALHFYACTLLAPPVAMMGQEMRWVARTDLADLDFPPADADLIRRLRESGSPTP